MDFDYHGRSGVVVGDYREIFAACCALPRAVVRDSFADSHICLRVRDLSEVVLCLFSLYMTFPWLQSTVFGVIAFSIILLLIYACRTRDELKVQGIMLSYAAQYTKEQPSNILLIVVWLALLGGITSLFIWQQVAFSYNAGNNNNLFDFTNPGVLGFLNIFQYLWGLQFLKLACIVYDIQLYSCCRTTRPIGTGASLARACLTTGGRTWCDTMWVR